LAEARPDTFLPDLATSLIDLGVRLSEQERWTEALAADEEAAAAYERLARSDPGYFAPDHAHSLTNLAVDLRALGRSNDAVTASAEAVRVMLPLLQRTPWLLRDAGLSLVQRYVRLCEETDREPDEQILQPMYAVLVAAGILTPEEEE
jgi:Tetratricopeptide repeat